MTYDIIIIGSGLSGLICGNILSKEGYNVCILEKNQKIGGNLQSFERNGHIFDTGLHYIGSMDPGQTLHTFFKYLGLTDNLKLRKLDQGAYDVVSIGEEGREYRHAQGYDAFINELSREFPHEKEGIINYAREIQNTIKNIPLYDLENTTSYALNPDNISKCAMGSICEAVSDNRLRSVLAGANAMYHGATKRTPLYLHACIRNSFISSAWRPVGNSDQIATLLAEGIEDNGGTILTGEEVNELNFGYDKISGVRTSSGKYFDTRKLISTIHPAITLSMIPDEWIRKAYRTRISSLENTPGFFTLNLILKKNRFPYLNYNYFHYNSDNYFNDQDNESWPDSYLLYTPAVSNQDDFTETASVLSFMNFDKVKKWSQIPSLDRGEEYKDFKEKMAEKLLKAVSQQFPGFNNMVESYYISTPLTFEDYTGTKEGTAYGILKDCENPVKSIILPKTRIPNLYLSGQNLNIHGVLGTTISSVITCSELIGFRNLLNKIVDA